MSQLFSSHPFKHKFKIEKFKESPISNPKYLLGYSRFASLMVEVQRKGNKDYVVVSFRLRDHGRGNYSVRSAPPFAVICSCTVTILDIEGHQRFPRSVTFHSESIYADAFEEMYIERNYILNNASEYLQEDTLTVIGEGTLEKWGENRSPLTKHRFPSKYFFKFHVEELEHELKVYILGDSHPARLLREHSSVFGNMLSAPMREGQEKRILLRKEELPAFLCTLYFMETEALVLYKAKMTDLYKIAHMYDIPIVLKKCRKYMEKYLPKNRQAILEFATFYDDVELKRIAESCVGGLPGDTPERNENLEMENELDGDFVCDTRPVFSNFINTQEDIQKHIRKFLTRILSKKAVEAKWGLEPGPFDFYQ